MEPTVIEFDVTPGVEELDCAPAGPDATRAPPPTTNDPARTEPPSRARSACPAPARPLRRATSSIVYPTATP